MLRQSLLLLRHKHQHRSGDLDLARRLSSSSSTTTTTTRGGGEGGKEKEEEESIESIARRNGKFDFLRVAERLFENQGKNDDEGDTKEGNGRRYADKREEHTRRWEYHAWHFLCALMPLGLSMAMVSYVRRNPHPNLVERAKNEKEKNRIEMEEALKERKKLEQDVIESARKEEEARYGKLMERMERLEKEVVEAKKTKRTAASASAASDEVSSRASLSSLSSGASKKDAK